MSSCPSLSRPLQEMQASHQHESDLSSFADSYSQSQSLACQPSQGNMSSFSVFEDSKEQSSFVPFHDSWANSSKDTVPSARQISSGQQPREQVGAVQRDVYRATLGVPLEGEGTGAGNVTTMDQSFTQVGICHPKTAPSISTPVSSRIGAWPYSCLCTIVHLDIGSHAYAEYFKVLSLILYTSTCTSLFPFSFH